MITVTISHKSLPVSASWVFIVELNARDWAGPKNVLKAPNPLHVEVRYAKWICSVSPGRDVPDLATVSRLLSLTRTVGLASTAKFRRRGPHAAEFREIRSGAHSHAKLPGSFRPESPACTPSETNGRERGARRNVHPCPTCLRFDGKRPDSWLEWAIQVYIIRSGSVFKNFS